MKEDLFALPSNCPLLGTEQYALSEWFVKSALCCYDVQQVHKALIHNANIMLCIVVQEKGENYRAGLPIYREYGRLLAQDRPQTSNAKSIARLFALYMHRLFGVHESRLLFQYAMAAGWEDVAEECAIVPLAS